MVLGRFFGLKLILNPLFLFLLGVYIWLGLGSYLAVVLLSLIAHELAHLVVIRSFDLRVSEVELLPFGGVARLEDLVENDPYVESTLAMAGPLANFALAALFHFTGWGQNAELGGLFLETNLVLGLFNLLPALPLDGGRLWRAHLARRVGFQQASVRLVLTGRIVALLLLLVGLLAGLLGSFWPNLFILGGFLFLAAGREKRETMFVIMRQLMEKGELIQSEGVLPAVELVALENLPLREVLRRFAPHKYHLVLTVNEELQPQSSLPEKELLEALFRYGPEVTMKDISRKDKR